MVDVFGLLDKENDETLYKFLDKLHEFWALIELSVLKIDDIDL